MTPARVAAGNGPLLATKPVLKRVASQGTAEPKRAISSKPASNGPVAEKEARKTSLLNVKLPAGNGPLGSMNAASTKAGKSPIVEPGQPRPTTTA